MKFKKKVKKFLLENPKASFDEVEKYCFPGEDSKWEFTAISPRVIEAALLDSCQVLVEGKYSDLLEPWKNYIPIKADASNWDDVYLAMKDHILVQRMITETRLKLMDLKELKALIKEEVTEKLDHKNLNEDIDFLKGQMPSIENIIVAIWEILDAKITDGKLHYLKLIETENNFVEYYGE